MAIAMQLVHQITTIALMMALPPLGGYWLDSKWNTSPWLLVTGGVLGMASGMLQLFRLVGVLGGASRNKASAKSETGPGD